MPITKLPALSPTWVELDSTPDILSMIVDPFSQVKSGPQPENAVLLRCGLGFIERSIDGGDSWAIVTPTTSPPNNAEDSPAPTAGSVTYNQLDGSISILDEFVVLVTWQNTSSEWRTWLYHTGNSFMTDGTWVAIDGGSINDLTNFNTPQVIHGIPDDHDPDPYWSESFNGGSSIVRLSNTKMVVSYHENASDNIFEGYLTVIDIQANGTLTIGPKRGFWNFVDGGDVNEVHGEKIFFWDSTHVLILSHEYDYEFDHDLNGDWALLARLASISGDTVTFGAATEVDNDYFVDGDFYPFHWDFDKTPGANDWGIICYSDWQFSPSFQNVGLTRMIQKTGTLDLTVSSTHYIWAPDEAPGCDGFSVTSIDTTTSVVFFSTGKDTGSGTFEIHCVHMTNSGYVITPGTEQYLGGRCFIGVRSIMLDTNRFIFVREEAGLFATSVSRSGTTYTVESNFTIVADSNVIFGNFMFHALDDTRFVCTWDSGFEWGIWARIVFMTGTYTMSGGTTATHHDEPLGHSETDAMGAFASDEYIIAYWYDAAYDTVDAATASVPVGNETKGLGVSIGKGVGNKAWVTIWDSDDGLSLVDIALPGLVENNRFVLNAATEAQINSKTWIAYPYAMFGVDSNVLVFGRMDSPQGLSSPEHVIYTLNSGASFSSLENGFGARYCGSARSHPDGSIYAIKNDGASSQLFSGDLVFLELKSTLPHSIGVVPAGMVIDLFNKSIIAGAMSADSIMVAIAEAPHDAWVDITSNHGVSVGVTSVIVL